MSFWIYNMGLAVPVSRDNLLVKRNVKTLKELAKTTDFSHSNEPDAKQAQPIQSKGIAGYNQQTEAKPQLKPVTFAEQIMSTKIKYLFDDMSFMDAWGEFRQHRYRHFPVVNKNKLIVGIVSDRDMLTAAATNKSQNILVRQIMKQPVLTATANSLIAEVCQIMFKRHIGALPITDEKNKILGLITRSDILRSMIKHGPIQLWV